jgi:hypothetical protein
MEIRHAQRQKARIKMALQGPSGSGKTLGALKIAYGLTGNWERIAIIDTENHSADLYSHLGNYLVANLPKPFTPERYIQAIELCESANVEVIIIDSISAEWEGAGGVLEVHGNMPGNSFTNWSRLTPRHNAFVQKMLQTPVHVIATIRTKQDYVLSEKDGKMVPEKVGLKGITRDGMDYEFTLVLDIDIKHNASATKDRTGLFMDQPPFKIDSSIGEQISKWCNQGVDVEDVLRKVSESSNLDQLRNIYVSYPQFRPQIEVDIMAKKEEIERLTLKAS